MRFLLHALIAAVAIAAGYCGLDLLRSRVGPVPQDPAAQEQRRLQTLEWNRRTLAGAYEAVGKKDPRWDGDARQALEAAARFFSKVDRKAVLSAVQRPAARAIARGCDDPLILYLHVRSSDLRQVPYAKVEQQAVAAAAALTRSAYPAFRRSAAVQTAAVMMMDNPAATPASRAEALRLFDDALRLLVVSSAEDERSSKLEDIWVHHLLTIVGYYRRAGLSPEAALARVEAALGQSPAMDATRLVVRGSFFTSYAWEARGNGFATTVTSDGWAKFRPRLAEARTALEAAWKIDPGNGRAATAMMNVELGDSRGRAAMELWFGRALAANSDNLTACKVKLDWLHPKWYGSTRELVAFGRACRDTKNWRSGIPLLVAEAHLGVCDRLPDDDARKKYLRQKDVWSDFQFVYTEYLKQNPKDHFARSEFAYYCCMCGWHDESWRQFETLGKNLCWGGRRATEQAVKEARAYVTKVHRAQPN